MSEPLVSCILPTSKRPDFLKCAIAQWRAQTYPKTELVMIEDDGSRLLGEKRNALVRAASGDLICHWDDDDIYAPDRISDQVARLLESDAEITGYNPMLFVDEAGQRWRYRNGDPNYCVGVSLMYRKEVAVASPFPTQDLGEDHLWMREQIKTGRKIVTTDGGERLIARIHAGNTSPKTAEKLAADCWQRVA